MLHACHVYYLSKFTEFIDTVSVVFAFWVRFGCALGSL